MRKRDFIIGAAALAACSQQEQKAEPPAGGDPADVIRAVYAPYLTERDDNLPELVDRAPWSASMRQALIELEARAPLPGEGIDDDDLVFDPFLSAQEWGIENNDLNVVTESLVPQSHAVVRATFNRGMEVVYDMVWEDGGWRIENMRSGGPPDGWDLRQIATRERPSL